MINEARAVGLPTIVWSYARGNMSKKGETAIDVIAYAAQIACQLGAHIVKVKPPTAHVEQDKAKPFYKKIPHATLEQRIKHVVQSCFNGKRIVIFSGGAAKAKGEVIKEIEAIAKGGGFGSIVGRNAFQRPHKESIELLQQIMDIHAAGGASKKRSTKKKAATKKRTSKKKATKKRTAKKKVAPKKRKAKRR